MAQCSRQYVVDNGRSSVPCCQGGRGYTAVKAGRRGLLLYRAWHCMVGLFWFFLFGIIFDQYYNTLQPRNKNKRIYISISQWYMVFLGLLFSIIDFFCLFSLVFIFEYLVIKVHFFYYTMLIYSYKLSPKHLVDKCTNDMN